MGLFTRRKRAEGPTVSAVVVAAGTATRMEGIDKQRAPIDDIPVVVRSIARLDECPLVTEIVVVCPETSIADYYDLVRDHGLSKVCSVVKGGERRQDSVAGGVAACRDDAAYLAIHDGARPLVTPDEIEGCILAAFQHGAAAVATPVKDTVKVAGPDGMVRATPNREELWAVQTPQVFAADRYRRALEQARSQGLHFTDDCQLFERAGYPVFLFPGSYQNIKITTPEDLAIAQAILGYREEGVSGWISE